MVFNVFSEICHICSHFLQSDTPKWNTVQLAFQLETDQDINMKLYSVCPSRCGGDVNMWRKELSLVEFITEFFGLRP